MERIETQRGLYFELRIIRAGLPVALGKEDKRE